MNIRVTSAKIKNLFCEFSYKEIMSEREDDIVRCPDIPVHEDLTKAFNTLVPHLIGICEFDVDGQTYEQLIRTPDLINEPDLNLEDIDKVNDFVVTGFKVGGSGESEGVTLIGQRRLSSGGKILNLVAPFTKWEDASSNLQKCIQLCQMEVVEYLQGKRAPKAQQEIPFGDEGDPFASEGEEPKPKRRARKAA